MGWEGASGAEGGASCYNNNNNINIIHLSHYIRKPCIKKKKTNLGAQKNKKQTLKSEQPRKD